MMRDATEIARARADAMWAEDKASAMGMQIEKVGPGFAIFSMSVGVDMVNCRFRLGVRVQLATSPARSPSWLQGASACACWPRPGSATGASGGIYDVTVRTEDGETIAEFRGHSRPFPAP